MIRSASTEITIDDVDKILNKIASKKSFSVDRSTADGRILSVDIKALANGGDVGTFTDVTAERK